MVYGKGKYSKVCWGEWVALCAVIAFCAMQFCWQYDLCQGEIYHRISMAPLCTLFGQWNILYAVVFYYFLFSVIFKLKLFIVLNEVTQCTDGVGGEWKHFSFAAFSSTQQSFSILKCNICSDSGRFPFDCQKYAFIQAGFFSIFKTLVK